MLNKFRVWSLVSFLIGLRAYQQPYSKQLWSLLMLHLTRYANWRVCCAKYHFKNWPLLIYLIHPQHNKTGGVHISVTPSRVRETIFALEKQKYYVFSVCVLCVCVCVCVSVAWVIQYAESLCHFDCRLCLVRMYRMCSRLSNGTILGEGDYWKQNACSDFVYNFCPKRFSS